jgi:hypothetical protein
MASGMSLKYPNLRAEKEIDEVTKKPTGKTQFVYTLGNKTQKLYPGRICNNVTQGTARIAYSEGLLRVAKRYFVAGLVHDEGIFVVPEKEAEEADVWIRQQMSQTPVWMPGIPLDSTIGHAVRYGDAK